LSSLICKVSTPKAAFGFDFVDDPDFFLHPGLSPTATAGRGVVNATVNMIQGFRKAGMKVLWTNASNHIPKYVF
jgi:nicotinamidase-related amidase